MVLEIISLYVSPGVIIKSISFIVRFPSFKHARILRIGRVANEFLTRLTLSSATKQIRDPSTIKAADGKRVWKADPELLGTAPLTAELTARYWESLKSINCPILHVRGTKSLFVSDDLVAKMELTNPSFTNVDVSGAGHDVHIDKPDELEDIVRQFLKLDI